MSRAVSSSAAPPRHLVGPVPGLARAAGALGVLAAAALLAAVFLPYLVVGGAEVGPPHGLLDVLIAAVWPASVGAAGASVLIGWLPRLGLAALGSAGVLACGRALQDLYQAQDARAHPGLEVFFGQPLVTSTIVPATGVWVSLAGDLLLVAALALTLLAWPRSRMEDAGDFEGRRPLVTGWAAVVAVIAMLAVASPAESIPDQIVRNPVGFETVVPVAGPASLLDRTGLDLASGVVLTVAVLLVTLFGAALRPRLATVGAFAAVAAYFTTSGLSVALEAGRSAQVVPALGGALDLVTAAALAVLALWCLRARGGPRAPVPPHAAMFDSG